MAHRERKVPATNLYCPPTTDALVDIHVLICKPGFAILNLLCHNDGSLRASLSCVEV